MSCRRGAGWLEYKLNRMYGKHRRVVCAVNAAMDQNCKLDVADGKREKNTL